MSSPPTVHGREPARPMSHANPARRTRPRRRAPPTGPIRLIAIDVDGTLLDGRGRLPARNRLAVHRAIDAGVRVVLVTGRAFHHARPVAEALAPERAPDALALIVSNGALTKRLDGATLDRRLLPRETARALVAAMRPRGQGIAVIFDRPDARLSGHGHVEVYKLLNYFHLTCAMHCYKSLSSPFEIIY